jgi:predicted dehydrogenase
MVARIDGRSGLPTGMESDTPTRKLALGVLGLGEGRSILSAAATSRYCRPHMLCDVNADLLARRTAESGVTRGTTRLDEMLADPEIDLVAIYTPDHLHAAHIRACLDAGKHVICTKPLLDDLAAGRKLLEVARRADRRVFVGQSSRFFEPMIRQRADFEAGKHGELITVESHYHHDHRPFLRQKDWYQSDRFNWVFGGLSHPVDLVRWYLPDIVEVCAYGYTSPGTDGYRFKNPDTVHVILRAADGRVARVSGCYGGPDVGPQAQDHIICVLRGVRGASQGNYMSLRYFTHFEGEGERTQYFNERDTHYFRFEGHTHHAGEFQNYLDYVGRSILAGDVPKPDLAEGLVTLAVMVAIDESIHTSRPVRIDDVLGRHGLGDLLAIPSLAVPSNASPPTARP